MKKYTHPLFFLFLLFTTKINAQQTYKEVLTMSKKEVITEKKVDSILASTKKDTLYADIAHAFSFFFNKKKQNYTLAIKYGLIEVKTLDSLKIFNRKHTNALFNLGQFHFRKQLFDTSIKFYKRAIKSNKYKKKVGQSYCRIGNTYFVKGKYYEAIDYFLKGIPLIEEHASGSILISEYTSLADVCNKMNSKETTKLGLYYLKKADSILQKSTNLKTQKHYNYYVNTAFANLYSLKHQYNYKKAVYYYTKNFEIARKHNDKYTFALTKLNIGELYLNKKNDSCLIFFKESLKNDYGKYNFYETYLNISKFYIYKENYKEALQNINNSLKYNFNSKINDQSEEDLLNVKDQRSLIKALKTKLIILLNIYKETNDNSYLSKAINTVNLTNKTIKLFIDYSYNSDTHFLWRSDVSEIFNLGIQATYLMNKPELMLQFMEENKAFLLTQSIKDNVSLSNLPEELTLKNKQLKKSILALKNQINVNEASLKRDSLLSLKIHHENFIDSIQRKYPELKKQNQNIKTVSLEELKEQLSKKDVVIYYALDKNNKQEKYLFGLFVSKEFDYIFKIKNTTEVINTLELYKNLISKPLTKQSDLNTFKKTAYFLYNELFPTEEIKNFIKNKNLTIVPDINLQNVPFEALNTTKDDLSYLIEKSSISYAYSMSFLDFNKKRKRKTEHNFTGLAPINFQNKKLTPLTHTKKELNTIENLIAKKSDIYVDEDATKETFLNSTQNSKIIHLATHAQTNPKPVIYFNKDSLNLHELYTYKNNADLVVLSACETNLGEIKKGEGTLSLARGFFYSGANSVISSLWNVNDASTTFLMKNFYSNLTDNQTKVDALTNAKRKYLKEHSLSERSPYYWASFVLIGDTSKTFENDYSLYFFLAFVALLVILFIFFKKRG